MGHTMTGYTIAICQDCVSLLANGEVTDGNGDDVSLAHGQDIDVLWGNTEITLGHLHKGEDCPDCHCSEDPEQTCEDFDNECEHGWFSWSACDGCGSNLGGTRSYATAWEG